MNLGQLHLLHFNPLIVVIRSSPPILLGLPIVVILIVDIFNLLNIPMEVLVYKGFGGPKFRYFFTISGFFFII